MSEKLVEILKRDERFYNGEQPVNVLPIGMPHIIFLKDERNTPENRESLEKGVSLVKRSFGKMYADANAYHCGFCFKVTLASALGERAAIPVQFYKISEELK